jgi:hypothetical protein
VVNNTTEVFTVDGKPSNVNGANGASGSQRVKATITPRPKNVEPLAPVVGTPLKSSPRLVGDKP